MSAEHFLYPGFTESRVHGEKAINATAAEAVRMPASLTSRLGAEVLLFQKNTTSEGVTTGRNHTSL